MAITSVSHTVYVFYCAVSELGTYFNYFLDDTYKSNETRENELLLVSTLSQKGNKQLSE